MHVRTGRSAPGFTLLELLATLAIMGIMAAGSALAWPQIVAALRLEAGIRQVAADLHDTRGHAIASAAPARVTFTRGSTTYQLEHADDDGRFQLTARRALPRGVVVGAVNSGGDLVFSARGNGENGTVVLADHRGRRATLRINQRGRVTVERQRT